MASIGLGGVTLPFSFYEPCGGGILIEGSLALNGFGPAITVFRLVEVIDTLPFKGRPGLTFQAGVAIARELPTFVWAIAITVLIPSTKVI